MAIQRYDLHGNQFPCSEGNYILHTDHLLEVSSLKTESEILKATLRETVAECDRLRTALSRFTDKAPTRHELLYAASILAREDHNDNLKESYEWIRKIVAKGEVGHE